VRSRKADTLRKSYVKYGDRVDIVVVEDLVKGDFTDALKGVSAVIHVATPGFSQELTDILEVGYLPDSFPTSDSHQCPSDHQGGSTQHRPPGCRCRCQTYLLRWNRRHHFGFHQPVDQGPFVRQGLEPPNRGNCLGFRQSGSRLQCREDTGGARPLEVC